MKRNSTITGERMKKTFRHGQKAHFENYANGFEANSSGDGMMTMLEMEKKSVLKRESSSRKFFKEALLANSVAYESEMSANVTNNLYDDYLHADMTTGFSHRRNQIESDPTVLITIAKLGRIGSSNLRFDDDFVDRLNYQFTGVILMIFIATTGFHIYLSDIPLQCWTPQQFTRSWEEYAETVCWISSTYVSKVDQKLLDKPDRHENVIFYYQWSTFFFAVQAFCFFLPCLIWRGLQNFSGFNLRKIMVSALKMDGIHQDAMNKGIHGMATYLDRSLRISYKKNWREKHLKFARCTYKSYDNAQDYYSENPQPNQTDMKKTHYSSCMKKESRRKISCSNACVIIMRALKNFCSFFILVLQSITNAIFFILSYFMCIASCGTCRRLYSCKMWRSDKQKFRGLNGTYLTYLYISVKLLYVFNSIFQLIILEWFVGSRYQFFGIHVLIDLLNGHNWHHTSNFPRVTFCDFEAKKLGENDKYTIQCVLPLNMLLEKLYIFLWFWFTLLSILSIHSLFKWFFYLSQVPRQVNFIRKYIHFGINEISSLEVALVNAFVEKHLRPDGILILKMISINSRELVIASLIKTMWSCYKNQLKDCDNHMTPKTPHPNEDSTTKSDQTRETMRHEQMKMFTDVQKEKMDAFQQNNFDSTTEDSIV